MNKSIIDLKEELERCKWVNVADRVLLCDMLSGKSETYKGMAIHLRRHLLGFENNQFKDPEMEKNFGQYILSSSSNTVSMH